MSLNGSVCDFSVDHSSIKKEDILKKEDTLIFTKKEKI